eukprot:scaffold830_cov377-Prasinococcus_capsulatus_cf.AAC.25
MARRGATSRAYLVGLSVTCIARPSSVKERPGASAGSPPPPAARSLSARWGPCGSTPPTPAIHRHPSHHRRPRRKQASEQACKQASEQASMPAHLAVVLVVHVVADHHEAAVAVAAAVVHARALDVLLDGVERPPDGLGGHVVQHHLVLERQQHLALGGREREAARALVERLLLVRAAGHVVAVERAPLDVHPHQQLAPVGQTALGSDDRSPAPSRRAQRQLVAFAVAVVVLVLLTLLP